MKQKLLEMVQVTVPFFFFDEMWKMNDVGPNQKLVKIKAFGS